MAKAHLLVALATTVMVAGGIAFLASASRQSFAGPEDRSIRLTESAKSPLIIVIMGTSLTAGYDWPDRLERELDSCHGLLTEVRLVAQPGANSAWGLTQLENPALRGADVVLVEFAINDADFWDGVSLRRAAALHQALITGLRETSPGVTVALMTMNPATGLRGWMRPRLTAHYMQYRRLATEMDTGLVDLWPRWLALPDAELGLEADGLHPSSEAAASLILPVLLPYLAHAARLKPCGHDPLTR